MDNIAKLLGKRLAVLRKCRKATQLQLAERAGLSLKHLGEIERGRGNPTLESLHRLAEALGISLSELFRLEKAPPSPEEIENRLLDFVKSSSAEQKQQLYRIVAGLAEYY
ncbi:MAG: helix-turn-helix transcriptional regulator [Desulfovibrionaceae bacterium]|nr:helix-turn-helix transcriptional regulator [Desulfovibrionaceae bacterium]MBF0513556.1 helix-turn-helix transcriptional regulator [Desulfovibrionaceae bacterium]